MTLSKTLRYFAGHSFAAIVASIISSSCFTDTLRKASCLFTLHVLIFWKIHRNDPIPNWLGSWDSGFGRVYANAFFVTLSHITTWVVLDRVAKVVLKQMADIVDSGRSLMSRLLLIECVIVAVATLLVFRPFQKVRSSFLVTKCQSIPLVYTSTAKDSIPVLDNFQTTPEMKEILGQSPFRPSIYTVKIEDVIGVAGKFQTSDTNEIESSPPKSQRKLSRKPLEPLRRSQRKLTPP